MKPIGTRDSRPRRFRRALRIALGVMVGLPLLAATAFECAVAWWTYPEELDRPAPSAARLEDRNGVPLAAFAAEDGQWRFPLREEEISPHLLKAIVAVEDRRFYGHGGVDWRAVAGAAWENMSALRVRRGASTLTMQVQRLRDPRPRTLGAKLREAVRACQLERRMSKRELLVEYLNRCPVGGNLVGAEAASWRYFGRSCRDLSLGEAALLAGLPQSPNRRRPDRRPERAQARRKHVLDCMLECGFISAEQRAEAVAEPIGARWRPLPQAGRPPASPADGALPALVALAQAQPGARRTTLDAAIQQQAARAAREQLALLEPSGVTAAAVVVLDTPTGECLATVSLSREAGGVDLARRPRSTGSALKPWIYAAAFDDGLCAPGTEIDDVSRSWSGYLPANYDRAFRGPMTAAEALAESRNLPAMVLLSRIGVVRMLGILEASGVRTPARSPGRYGLSLAIGGAEATPLEMAESYATLARGGIHRTVTFVAGRRSPVPGRQSPVAGRQSVGADTAGKPGTGGGGPATEDRGLRTCDRGQPTGDGGLGTGNSRRVLPARVCWQTLGALSAADRRARICPEAVGRHIAWKTGTSSGNRDAWCAAVTTRRTVVVWLGNTSGLGAHALVGQEAAAPLALRLIAAIDSGGEPWPVVESPAVDEFRSRLVPRPSPLTILSPLAGEEYVFSSDLPPALQQVLLRSAGGATASRRWWFVDGQPLGEVEPGERFWWPPARGAHEIRVVDAAGGSAAVRIRVR